MSVHKHGTTGPGCAGTCCLKATDLGVSFGGEEVLRDVSFHLHCGEIVALIGPNGAGKTTAIRHLLGFSTPDHGTCRINGMDCFHKAKDIHRSLGYLPGEIAFMDDMTGKQFLLSYF